MLECLRADWSELKCGFDVLKLRTLVLGFSTSSPSQHLRQVNKQYEFDMHVILSHSFGDLYHSIMGHCLRPLMDNLVDLNLRFSRFLGTLDIRFWCNLEAKVGDV